MNFLSKIFDAVAAERISSAENSIVLTIYTDSGERTRKHIQLDEFHKWHAENLNTPFSVGGINEIWSITNHGSLKPITSYEELGLATINQDIILPRTLPQPINALIPCQINKSNGNIQQIKWSGSYESLISHFNAHKNKRIIDDWTITDDEHFYIGIKHIAGKQELYCFSNHVDLNKAMKTIQNFFPNAATIPYQCASNQLTECQPNGDDSYQDPDAWRSDKYRIGFTPKNYPTKKQKISRP